MTRLVRQQRRPPPQPSPTTKSDVSDLVHSIVIERGNTRVRLGDGAGPVCSAAVRRHHRNALTCGRADRELLQGRERIVGARQPDGEIEPALAFEDLRHHPALRRRFDGILNVLDVDAVAGARPAIDDDLQLRHAHEVIVVEIRHAVDGPDHVHELARFHVHHEVVGPVELDGELALDAGHRFVDVVLDGLREVEVDAGDAGVQGG